MLNLRSLAASVLLAWAVAAGAPTAQAAVVSVDYSATLTTTCPRVDGCSFGSAPNGFSVAQNEDVSAQLLISFLLDTSAPIFSVAAGESVPGTTVVAASPLVSYGAGSISNLTATFAGVDLVNDPAYGLSEAGFALGSFGTVPGALLLEGVAGVGPGLVLDMIFGPPGPTNATAVGSFLAAGNTRLAQRNTIVNVDDEPFFFFGDADGTFRVSATGVDTLTATVVPLPAPIALLLSGLVLLGLWQRQVVSCLPNQSRGT